MIARLQEGKVLVPWNFSEQSNFALRSALEIAGGDSSQLRVLHVAAPLSGPDNGVLYDSAEKLKTRELRQKFRKHVSDQQLQEVQFHVTFGYVVQEITRFTENFNPRLVVLSSRKRQGGARFWFRRLPDKLIQSVKCPVLVVQQEQEITDLSRWQSLLGLKKAAGPAVS